MALALLLLLLASPHSARFRSQKGQGRTPSLDLSDGKREYRMGRCPHPRRVAKTWLQNRKTHSSGMACKSSSSPPGADLASISTSPYARHSSNRYVRGCHHVVSSAVCNDYRQP